MQSEIYPEDARTRKFRQRPHNRYWWYKLADTDYIPPVYGYLTDEEWSIIDQWHTDSGEQFENPGEITVPGISMLLGLIGGNGVSRIVQCGHYAGYSTLLLGFMLRRMGKPHSLFSIDIDPDVTEYTRSWVEKAGLSDFVHLEVSDSADPAIPEKAEQFLTGKPQLVFIDSSHQYAHTFRELDLWYDVLPVGGLCVLHDVSEFARSFDASGEGGVKKALNEWAEKNGVQCFTMNGFVENSPPDDLVYRDGCGLGLLQKV
ncbi:class I SAM-dependent methyltransferase [Ruegeria atlantica]|uniref:class I SAM-dependent methyltransferase n=1 Tax=Ruegeria atlantica TaxID=81569 RepID=UPI00147F6A79|nr:class I SAM-dependent methyltransferase [Ruegeria atlantica]